MMLAFYCRREFLSLFVFSSIACFSFLRAEDTSLLTDSFQSESTNLFLHWQPMKGSQPWVIENDGVVATGETIFDSLESKDFPAITEGAFDLNLEVMFESTISGGDNRFFLRMRDSESANRGYEVVIAQGTANNTYIGLIGGGYSSKGLKSSAFTFPADQFVKVRWVRDLHGKMQVFVEDILYLELDDDLFSRFDRVVLGTRAFISEGDSGPSGLRHYFRNFELKRGPESL